MVNLFFLYTADRATGTKESPEAVIYSTASQQVGIKLWKHTDALAEADDASIGSLLEMVRWAYDEDRVSERMALIQIVLSQEMAAVEENLRCRSLLRNSERIFENLKWNWKAFIKGKV